MAGTRGYHNYRGRTSKAKAALMILLGVVILAAVVVMLLQRNVVYDETGTPQLELPWKEKPQEEELPDVGDVYITVGEAEKETVEQMRVQAFSVPVGVLTREAWETAAADPAASGCTAVAVTLKDGGTLYFDPNLTIHGTVKTETDTAEVLQEITGAASGYHTIAKISCFHDSKAANSDVEGLGLKNTGGFIFYDGNNTQWLDPGKAAAREYLCGIVRAAAELGFDEILLTDVSYPTEGKLDKIDYGSGAQSENLKQFLLEVREVLEPYSMALSVEVPESVLLNGVDQAAGLVLRDVVETADRVYARTSPEQAAYYAAQVSGMGEGILFVPELAAAEPVPDGSWLRLEK